MPHVPHRFILYTAKADSLIHNLRINVEEFRKTIGTFQEHHNSQSCNIIFISKYFFSCIIKDINWLLYVSVRAKCTSHLFSVLPLELIKCKNLYWQWWAVFWVWLTAFRHLLFHCEVEIVDIVNTLMLYNDMACVFIQCT